LDLAVLCQSLSRHLELSEYESKVYVGLVVEGVCEARRISTRSGVPRTKVYFTLKKLMERGLVFEVSGEPRRFAPMPPSKAFEQCLSHFRDRASDRVISLVESQEVVAVLEKAYEKTRSTNDPQKEEVWIFHNMPAILGKMKEMLNRAKKTVTVMTNENGLVFFYRTSQKMLDKMVEKNVKIQIVVPTNSDNKGLVRELGYICKIKNVNITSPFLYLCVDEKAFFLAKLNLNNFDLESENNIGFVCYSSTACDLFSKFVDGLVGIRKESNEINAFGIETS